jgi:Uma2 family endonuclease
MTPLLDLPAVRQRVHPMSVETYRRLGEMGALSEDVELLRGLVVTKMPKSPLHEYVAQMLMMVLLRLLPPGFQVRCERPLSIGGSEPEPDLSVVRGEAADWLRSHPRTASLVVEVAVTSQELDEGKASIYAEAGIPEYWIVEPEARRVTVFREPVGEDYRSRVVLADSESVRCVSLPEVEIPIASVLPPKV